MTTAAEAAAIMLVRSFGNRVSGRQHSVWVRNEIQDGVTTSVIMVALRPEAKTTIKLPDSYKGFAVRAAPWGRVYSEPSEA